MKKTAVKFLVNESENDLFAYFPTEIADSQKNRLSYAHIGQHSACAPDYAEHCRPATKQEFEPLKLELEQLGYSLKIIN
jgi:hypothetical protein